MAKKFWKSKKLQIAGLSVLAAACASFGVAGILPQNATAETVDVDLTKLYGQFKKIETLNAFETQADLDKVSIVSGVESKELVSAFANAPKRSSEGTYSLELRRALIASNDAMKVQVSFGEEKDFTQMPLVYFNVNSYGGQPGATQYLVKAVALGGDEEATYSKTYGYYANQWNSIGFDMTDCPYLDSISGVQLEFFTNSDSEVNWEGSFQVDNLFAAKMVDFRFAADGDLQGFTATNAKLTAENDVLKVTATGNNPEVIAPEMTYTRVLSYLYTSAAQIKNTIYTVIDNQSSATEMTIYYRTTNANSYNSTRSKTIEIEKNTKKLYAINFSDQTDWNGNVNGFKYAFSGAKTGETILIDNIELHEDEVLEDFAGEVTSITAAQDKKSFTVQGVVGESYRNSYSSGTLNLYAAYVDSPFSSVIKGEPLATIPVSSLSKGTNGYTFSFNDVNFVKFGDKTYADHYFTVALKQGANAVAVDRDRGIDNWTDFVSDKYAFENPTTSVDVLTKGAKGDGFTDDTAAIQKAIDDLHAQGGGKVIIGGNRTYKVTTLRLKNNITIWLEEGSVLRQSEDFRDYDYDFELGHNSIAYSHINWSHCNVVSNYPLLLAQDVKNVKVQGGGTIIMSDADNYGDDLMTKEGALEYQYSCCSHRLHSMPIGMYNCENVEISNLKINKSSGYHVCVTFCKNMTIYDVEMSRVKCVSSDGISLGGSDCVYVEGAYLNGNDDGIVLSAVYEDPRELWHFRQPGNEQAARNIEVYSSYVQSGGGKAIAVITWGTSDPEPTLQEIRNITVKDCTLAGGFAVGVWPDNPYNGKQPFDNSETNDFSAIKDFTIVGNEYLSPVNLWPVTITGLITDAGITGSSVFVNAEFDERQLYWTMQGDASIVTENNDKVAKVVGEGSVSQGLWLTKGEYLVKYSAKAIGEGAKVGVINEATGAFVVENAVNSANWDIDYLFFVVPEDGNYRIGLYGADGVTAYADSFSHTSKTFEESGDDGVRKELYTRFDEMPEGFTAGGTSWALATEDGENILRQTNNGVNTKFVTDYASYTDFSASVDIRFDSFNGVDNMVTFGIRNTGTAAYVVYFSAARNQIAIRKDKNGEAFLATTSFGMSTGVWYRLGVTCETLGDGVKITLTINGETVLIGTDTGSIIKKGAFSLGCYNTAASFDNVYVTAAKDTANVINVTVKNESGAALDGVSVQLFENGVLGGAFISSADGTIEYSAESATDIYYTAKKFGYQTIMMPTKLDVSNPTIVLNKAKNILIDEYETMDYLVNAGGGYSVANGKLIQSDGANNVQAIETFASGFGDFTATTNLRYTGGNAGAGNNVSMLMYKGGDRLRIEWQPYYGLFGVYKFNVSQGQNFHKAINSDLIKAVGSEIELVFGTKNKVFTLTAYVNGTVLLETEYALSYETDSTRIMFSTYGVTYESDYLFINAESGSVLEVVDEDGRMLDGVSVGLYNGTTLVETVTTDENGVAYFASVGEGYTYKIAAHGVYDGVEATASSIVKAVLPYKNDLFEADENASAVTDTLTNESFGGIFTDVTDGFDVCNYTSGSGVKGTTAKSYETCEITFTLGTKDHNGNASANVRVYVNGLFFYYTPVYGWFTLCAAENDFVNLFRLATTDTVNVRIVVGENATSLYAAKVVGGVAETETLVRTITKTATASQISVSAYMINAELLNMKVAYEKETFTVVFVDASGNVISTQNVFEAKDIVLPDTTGIDNFAAWDTDLTTVQSDCVVFPIVAETGYTVVFKDEAGNTLETITVYGDAPVGHLPAVSVDELKMHLGWKDADGNVVDVFAIRQDAEVYAYTGSVKHRITFVDGNGKLYHSYFADGETIVAPTLQTVAGHTMVGYDVDFDKATCDMVIYAKYQPNEITVHFVDAEGNKIDDVTVMYGSVATPPVAPEKDGYVFVGYDKSLAGIVAETTFTATYEKKSYEVIFFDYYGNVLSKQEIVMGEAATAPTLDSDAQNIFKGWDTAYDAIQSYTEIRPVMNDDSMVDVTLVNTVTGSFTTVQVSKEAPREIEAPTADGYVFAGWYYDAALTQACDIANDTFDGNIYLYSKWNKLVSVTIESDGGKVEGLAQSLTEGETYTFTVKPDGGKKVSRVTVAGKVIEEKDGKYTFTAPSADFTVKVTYEKSGGCRSTLAFNATLAVLTFGMFACIVSRRKKDNYKA